MVKLIFWTFWISPSSLLPARLTSTHPHSSCALAGPESVSQPWNSYTPVREGSWPAHGPAPSVTLGFYPTIAATLGSYLDQLLHTSAISHCKYETILTQITLQEGIFFKWLPTCIVKTSQMDNWPLSYVSFLFSENMILCNPLVQRIQNCLLRISTHQPPKRIKCFIIFVKAVFRHFRLPSNPPNLHFVSTKYTLSPYMVWFRSGALL